MIERSKKQNDSEFRVNDTFCEIGDEMNELRKSILKLENELFGDGFGF